MAFQIRVNGETVKEFTEQVTGVHVRTAHGEAAALGIGDVGAVDVVVDVVNAGDPMRLDVLEARQAKERRDMIEEGMVTGPSAQTGDATLGVKQDLAADEDANPVIPPGVDLSQGLDPNDPDYVDQVTARIESFTSSGDAQAAIEGTQPSSSEPPAEPPAEEPVPADSGFGIS